MASAGTAYVDVEAKLDSFGSEIDAAVSALDTQTIDVEAVASTDQAQAEIDSIEGGTTEIAVEADTAAAQEQVDQLTDSTSKLGEAAQGALGGMGGLGGAAGGATSAMGATAIAGAGAAAGLFSFAQAAVDAESASQRFQLITGDLGDELQTIDVGGLSGDIGDLALQLGSSDEAMLNATATFVSFAESTGATGDEIATVSDDINALALRAVALNPALGDAGAVAERMTTAFGRGGRALVPFGIGLTSAEINARALADTGKASADELTMFEKAAAGAAIATERLGDSMGSDFAAGAQNARTEWNRMTESLGEAQEQLGSTMLPAIENITEAVTEMATGISEMDLGSLMAGLWDISGPGLFVNGMTDAYNAITGTTGVAEGMGTVIGELPPALSDTAGAADDVAGAVDGLGNSLRSYLDGTFGLPEAQRALRDSFQDLFGVLLTEGHTADDVAAAMEQIAYKTADVGAASGDMSVAADLTIQRLRGMRDAGQLTREEFIRIRDAIRGAQDQAPLTVPTSAPGATTATGQVKGLGDAVGKLPPERVVGVHAEGAAQAREDVAMFKRQLDALPKNVYVGIQTTGSANTRASGGPVSSGESYLVGEEGPEMFVPRRSGTIIPAPQTAAMVGAGVHVGQITVHAGSGNGDEIARAISDELRKLERASR